MDHVKKCLQEAIKLYVNKLGHTLIPVKDWPPFFKRIGENVQWSNESVFCVIRKPNKVFWMIVICHEEAIADISVNYVTQDGIFHSLALAHRDNSPFSNRAASALKEIQVTSSSWQNVVKKIRMRKCSDAESIRAW